MLFKPSIHSIFVGELDVGYLTLTPIVRNREMHSRYLDDVQTHMSVFSPYTQTLKLDETTDPIFCFSEKFTQIRLICSAL